MKKIINVTAAAVLTSLAVVSQPSFAASCSAVAVKPLTHSCIKRDKAKHGNAHAICSATITAPKGHFIMGSDLSVSFNGSTHVRSNTVSKKPYGALKAGLQKKLFNNVLHSSVTARSECKRGKHRWSWRSCYAAAKVTAKAYPHVCLKSLIEQAMK